MIYRYLPESMLPKDMKEIKMGDFYRLLAVARQARKMYQEDLERGILEAISKLFPEG